MGLFRKKEKEYTFDQAIKMLKEEGFENHIAIPTNPEDMLHTKYWLRLDEKVLKETPYVETPFQEKRRKMMEEIGVDEECKKRTEDISRSHSSKPGKVIRYNDYQSARNYQKKYGEYSRW